MRSYITHRATTPVAHNIQKVSSSSQLTVVFSSGATSCGPAICALLFSDGLSSSGNVCTFIVGVGDIVGEKGFSFAGSGAISTGLASIDVGFGGTGADLTEVLFTTGGDCGAETIGAGVSGCVSFGGGLG